MNEALTTVPGWRPKKALGQNFLVNEGIARKIVDAFAVQQGETVVEIGPGRGALTSILCQRAGRVIAVELDREMARTLPDRVPADNLIVVERDILKTDLALLADEYGVERWPVVGNLPYVIGSRLLVRLVEQARTVERATVMVQLEVGERILAGAGSRTYGLLSVLLQATGRLRREFRVSPGAFRPMPTVQSLVFSWQSDPAHEVIIPALIATTKAAFSQRRKRLGNALKSLPGARPDIVNEACRQADVDPGLRAEQLAPQDFVRLSRAFDGCGVFASRRS